MASRSSDGRRYYFGLIRGTKHRFYDPESPIIAPESEPISETGSLETRSSSAESCATPTSSERGPASIDLRVSLSAWRQRASYAGAYLADAIGRVSLSPASAF